MAVAEEFRSLRRALVATLAALAVLTCVGWVPTAGAQGIDILLKGGHVIDPRNGIDGPMDVAIAGDRIVQVAADIPAAGADQVVDVSGLYVTPGLIDMHAHVFYREAARAIKPDVFTFRNGVTTVVDAGTSGWRNFPQMKEESIDISRTRVLAFLSITGVGSSYYPTESRIETQNVGDMDPVLTAFRVREFPDIIVGIKAQHYQGTDYIPEERAVIAAEMAGGVPVMYDYGGRRSLEHLFRNIMRPGDIYTHTYTNGRVWPLMAEAKAKGILFSVGHGGGGFQWENAIPGIRAGNLPDVIDTDTHMRSINDGMKDMTNLMSKFLAVGMSFQDVILRTTWNPAQAMKREDLGHLSVGSEADVAVFSVRDGQFGFIDAGGTRYPGTQRVDAELTIRAGDIVWDLNGLAAPGYEE